ncbi:PDZ domain-containing protein [Pricia sp. S334]|uniref:PDZ domain-containing protein n=1 Tax=Pricia mediterranea TaxID=3076079 RepID=A0ABU3L7G3_9FLAO|nr:PDZ domain-containing protein [Pricia sp. S334]MDT7829163.1 PDZ domain-containing protein [Pricia sp. S334]
MKFPIFVFLLFFADITASAQTNSYEISFENAVHHEAEIKGQFTELKSDTIVFRMARSSPGRYAIHEFAKNVYALKATDGQGTPLTITRPSPYQWNISGHDGIVNISYTLFADRGDGTYSQIDETHAHLNIPATFMYAPELNKRKIEVDFKVREDLDWKIATQMPLVSGTTYTAPDLQYFMDSPVEISDFQMREFEVDTNGSALKVQFVLHHNGTEAELDTYFEKVKKIVLSQREVFDELPDFDYGTYTFLACYLPNASGDGMEHRNSTVLTSTRALSEGGMQNNLGTVSHEFFHIWNVERIRPKSLQPFDFSQANMSGALWFAEGFTSYYTGLTLRRAGLIAPEEYIEGLSKTFNYVWNSPGRQFFNPIEMSYQAPFVDAASSIDPTNRENTFISYYSYGSMLGLALDLSLRNHSNSTVAEDGLDGFMKKVWQIYGKSETPYTLEDLHNTLNEHAGGDFGDRFFNRYIYRSGMPDYESLLESVGAVLQQDSDNPYIGIATELDGDGNGVVKTNPQVGTPAYEANLDKGDVITSINGNSFPTGQELEAFIDQFKVGNTLDISFERNEKAKTASVVLQPDPAYSIQLGETTDKGPSEKQLKRRKDWLKID